MRKWIVVFLAFGLVLFAGLFALVKPMPCPVNRAALERIEAGMSRAQVEAILGGPGNDYRTRPSTPDLYILWGDEHWIGDDGTIVVELKGSWEEFGVTPGGETLITYRGGNVSRKEFIEHTPSSHDLLELALWRLGRLKERLLP